MGKRLISFSLWGNKPLYNQGALGNVDEAKEVYPGWKCRFYVHRSSPALSDLKKMDCEVVVMDDTDGYIPEFWRFVPASEADIDYVIFRDCDSRVNSREAGAVDEWIRLGEKAHLMKDSETHKSEVILAGMWGVKGGVINNMLDLVHRWVTTKDIHDKYTDQRFLASVVWPLIKDSVVSHGFDSVAGPGRPFPPHKPMKYGEYVGMVIQV